MVMGETVCLRQLAAGCWAAQMQFWRFIGNAKVTLERLIEGWSEQTREAVEGRHVLAIQDTSELKFHTTAANRRGLGKVKKGNAFGVLLHAMIAVDARSGICLGAVTGQIWTRDGEVKAHHSKRPLSEKESSRWLTTPQAAKTILAKAAMITFIGDREDDIYAVWAWVPEENTHLLVRVMHDHKLVTGGTLRKAVQGRPLAAKGVIELRERVDRKARKAHVGLRFGAVVLARPKNTLEDDLPESVALNFVEVIEPHPPQGADPLHWLLLTTHKVDSVEAAWQIVAWYRQRWVIEQFFRVLKSQGLKIEDSQLQSADGLMKLVAIAVRAAAIIIQLVQSREGHDPQPASLAFTADEIKALQALNTSVQGKTLLQKNPHAKKSLAWAGWIIAKLGGWTGYASHRPPGPITFYNGLQYFRAFAAGWAYKNV